MNDQKYRSHNVMNDQKYRSHNVMNDQKYSHNVMKIKSIVLIML